MAAGLMETLVERNSDMLNEIALVIESNPDKYDQREWLLFEFDDPGVPEHIEVEGKEIVCGTHQCIAGWAVVLEHGVEDAFQFAEDGTIHYEATKILGLEGEEAQILFNEAWLPPDHVTVPEALRALASGAPLEAVTEDWDEY